MIETKEKIINGDTYSVTQLPARRAIRLQAKLIKNFGSPLSHLMLSSPKSTSQKDDLINAIKSLSSIMDENMIESLMLELMQGVRKNGMELNEKTIDMEFAGDIEGILQVCFFVLEVNFANFFTILGIGNLSSEGQTNQVDT